MCVLHSLQPISAMSTKVNQMSVCFWTQKLLVRHLADDSCSHCWLDVGPGQQKSLQTPPARPRGLLMQNRFKELHSLFNVVIPVGLPDVLVDSKRFSREIATPLQYGQKKDALPFQLAKVTWGNFALLPSGLQRSTSACCPEGS